MPFVNKIWETAEAYLNGTLSESDSVALKNLLNTDLKFANEFNECINLLNSLADSAKQQKFRNLLQDIEAENNKETKIKSLFTRIISITKPYRKTAAVAATVALLTSTITYWIVTPSIKKNNSQYNIISREVEHIKTEQKNQKIAIDSINKKTTLQPAPPSSVKYTGTGFALSNDGYFVTASHVINNGKFDSVYIQNQEGEYFKASLVAHDEKTDVAILKVDKKNFHFSKGDLPYAIINNKANLGSQIFTLGFPKDEEVYSEGYISSKNGFEGNEMQYTLELPAQHGQSGAPVIDANGNIIALLTAIGMQGESNTYAVSTKALFDLLENTPKINKIHFGKTTKFSKLSREQQIEKMETYTFSVKVYKK